MASGALDGLLHGRAAGLVLWEMAGLMDHGAASMNVDEADGLVSDSASRPGSMCSGLVAGSLAPRLAAVGAGRPEMTAQVEAAAT